MELKTIAAEGNSAAATLDAVSASINYCYYSMSVTPILFCEGIAGRRSC